MFFELCNGTIGGFNQANVDKLYICFGFYIRNDYGELEEINSDSESDYLLESHIENGMVLEPDGSYIDLDNGTILRILDKEGERHWIYLLKETMGKLNK